jgi:hypothetical protein
MGLHVDAWVLAHFVFGCGMSETKLHVHKHAYIHDGLWVGGLSGMFLYAAFFVHAATWTDK